MLPRYPQPCTPLAAHGIPSLAATRAILAQIDTPGSDMLVTTGGVTLALTNLDRRLWPAGEPGGCRKRDLVRYYARVAPFLLPHLVRTAISLIRYPLGVGRPASRERSWARPHWVLQAPDATEARAPRSRPPLVTGLASLLWLGQKVAIELAPLPEPLVSRSPSATAPAFELTLSGAGAEGFARARDAAFQLRRAADGLGVKIKPRTSGRDGVCCRVWGEVAADTGERQRLAARLLRAAGVSASTPARPLIPLSPTADPRGLVSMPLTWAQLEDALPDAFTLYTVPELLQHCGDPWRDTAESPAESPEHGRRSDEAALVVP